MLSTNPTSHQKTNEASEFYQKFTLRNRHFISNETQNKLSQVKVLIAGCGTTGGACIHGLSRVGVQHFILADNGDYELDNLNRQYVTTQDLNQNKAIIQKKKLLEINPFAHCETVPEGVTPENALRLVKGTEFIIDAVDVTDKKALNAKVALHKAAHLEKIPVVTGMDLGFCQWAISFDYRDQKTLPLNGKAELVLSIEHPLKAWLSYIPLSAMPNHVLPMIEECLRKPLLPPSQLCVASDLLAASITPVLIRYLESGALEKKWEIHFEKLKFSRSAQLRHFFDSFKLKRKIKKTLKTLA